MNTFPVPEDALPRDKAKERGAAAGRTHSCQMGIPIRCKQEDGARGTSAEVKSDVWFRKHPLGAYLPCSSFTLKGMN